MRILWMVICTALLLCGCGEERYEKVNFEQAQTLPIEVVDSMPEFEVHLSENSSGTLSDEGRILRKSWEDTTCSTLYFFDAETEDLYPLCPKTNCSHDTDACPAYVDAEYLHWDGEYLYYVSDDGWTADNIVRQRIDGSDREILFQQEAADNGTASIMNATFRDGKVYYTVFGGVFDPETGEITTGEKICIGDLATGETTVIPIEFGEGTGSTLSVLGLYANTMLLWRTTGGEVILGRNNYHETLFLLDLDTYEITVIAEYDLEDSRAFQMVGENLLMIELNFDPEEPDMEHPVWGTIYEDQADILIVDLEHKNGYLQKDVLMRSYAESCDEFFFYTEWNEELGDYRRMILDLTTGERRPWPEGMASLYGLTRQGDYIYAWDRSRDRCMVRILEADFWTGIPNFYTFPDWV